MKRRPAAAVEGAAFGTVAVHDDLIPSAERERIARFLAQPIWQYGWRSDTRHDRFSYWHAHFAGGDHRSRESCEPHLAAYPALAPIYRLWLCLKESVLKNHVPLRAYANAHTYGVEGYVHTDNLDTDNYFSTLYYAHPRWDRNWAGETVFYDKDERDIIASVYPRPGRVASFHGAVPHCARAPSRECAELRLTVVFKTQLAP